MSHITDPDRARRAARVVVRDLASYHDEQVREGIVSDDLFERLAQAIAEGRHHYESKVSPEIARDHAFFELALVDVLVFDRGSVQSKIW